MSVPSAELTAPAATSERRAYSAALSSRLSGARLYLALAAGALVIGALSLLLPSTPSYDPWAWLVWGREIVHLNLHTTDGPTWKPLPMIFTTVFAPFGKAQPNLWLMVARAGGVMSVAMVFRLCWRLTRQLAMRPDDASSTVLSWAPAILAGLIAAIGLTLSGGYISDNALGYSEGLLTAIVLVSLDLHLDGRYRAAFTVGFFAALDRPEIWLLWGPYGLWLFWKDAGARKLVVALFVLIPVFWFLPEYWGSGHFFRGVSRAHTPRSNSPAFAKCPICSELVDHAWPTVLLRIKIAAILAVGAAAALLWRGRHDRGGLLPRTPREHAMAGIVVTGVLGIAWWVVIGVMTQAGFSGNNRYLVLGAALIEVAGAVGFGWAVLELSRVAARRIPSLRGAGSSGLRMARWGAVGLLVLVFIFLPNYVGKNLINIPKTHGSLAFQARLRDGAQAAVEKLGGRDKIYACGTVMTEGFQVPMLAWMLDVHTVQVEASPLSPSEPGPAPNVIFQTREHRHAHLLPFLTSWPTTHYQLVLHNRTFRVYEHCANSSS